METTSFELVHIHGDLIRKSDSLKDIWKYVKTEINDPRKYEIDELDNYGVVATRTAYSLIENFKTEESVPLTLTEIN